jgi:predicted NBD/HSP70 family sugar kinase
MDAPIRTNGKRVWPATPASVRHVNRSILLHLVRLHQPVSRAQLSQLTGIYRSSISEIVDELIADGLLVERLSSPSGRGRVPIHLSLNANGFRVLGVSVRPFQTFVATSGLTGEVERSVSFRTPKQPEKLIRQLTAAVEQLKASPAKAEVRPIEQIGIGLPGTVDANTGTVSMLPSLPEYSQYPIAAELKKQFGVPVLVDNDCNLGALAELWLNAREVADLRDFVFLEVGDVGVGAGIVLGGSLYRGQDSTWVGEFGHMVIHPNGPECRCGRRGCWERFVSDEATWRYYDPGTPFDPERFASLIILAREERDSRALRAFRQTAEYLSLGIANICCALNPQTVIVAGEITKLWVLMEGIVQSRWAVPNLGIRVRPALTTLDELSVTGALALALSTNFGPPKLG